MVKLEGQNLGGSASIKDRVARDMDEGNIVAILPDGGWKYLSMDFWDRTES